MQKIQIINYVNLVYYHVKDAQNQLQRNVFLVFNIIT